METPSGWLRHADYPFLSPFSLRAPQLIVLLRILATRNH